MARMIKRKCKPKLQNGVNTIRPKTNEPKKVAGPFNSYEEAVRDFAIRNPGSGPIQAYPVAADSIPVPIRTFGALGDKELAPGITTRGIMKEKGIRDLEQYIGNPKPKLVNGVDNSLLNYDPLLGQVGNPVGDIALPSIKAQEAPQPKMPQEKPDISGSLMAGGEILAQGINALDTQRDGKTSVAGATATGAVAGGKAGMAIGGPIGAGEVFIELLFNRFIVDRFLIFF